MFNYEGSGRIRLIALNKRVKIVCVFFYKENTYVVLTYYREIDDL